MSGPVPWGALPLAILCILPSGAASQCGEGRRIEAFAIQHGAVRYLLPAEVKIEQSGVTLFEDEQTSEWNSANNGVEFSSFGDYLLLKTFWTDCVDIYRARLFMIATDGTVIHQPVWTSNWLNGFFVHDGKLAYWSEWFCIETNQQRRGGESYVYVFSETNRAFEQQDVPDSTYCSRSDEIPFLEFNWAEALPAP